MLSQSPSSDALMALGRSITPTPAANGVPEATVDLEAELFAFKPQPTTVASVCLLATEPLNKNSSLARSISATEKRASCNPLQSDAPIIVWDLESGSQPRRTQSDRTTLLARNSHCLRQWHPDLVENVGFVDTTEFVGSRPPTDPVNDIPGLLHGEIQFLLPKPEELTDITEWQLVCCRDADKFSGTELSDPDVVDRFCVVRVVDGCNQLLLATVTQPVLMYTGVQERINPTVSPEQSISGSNEVHPEPASNSNLPYVLRMAPRSLGPYKFLA
ncbi:unnamed protein product [Echinostoma caproni]|uniref:Uncharacterized protein n=1 Tax=Echinostoma caproni TaxID=27848 RepID=A0A3P8L0E1_9TREM|nr:unnamed protein product [Echinostoma caproni]